MLCLVSFWLGGYVTKDVLKTCSSDPQAMIAFNRIGDYTKIKSCLDNEKYDATSILIKNYLISQRELLADHLNTGVSPKMTEYIKIRTNEGIAAHKAYKSNRGNSWTVPSCK